MFKLKKVILLSIFTILVIFAKQNIYAMPKSSIPYFDKTIGEANTISYNNLISGRLKITVLDNNNMPIKNVTFYILDEDKNIVNSITTDENGIAISKELENGTYYYIEHSVPINVIPDLTEYPFRISEAKQTIIKKMINNLLERRLILYVLTSNYSPIENAKYNILDIDGNIVDTISTDYSGVATSKELEAGTYYYTEVSMPYGIVKNDIQYIFTINEDDNKCDTKTLIKRYASGILKLTCVDENGSGIMGITFNILDSSKNVLDTITTNKTGTAYSKNLNLGKYYYQIVSGPSYIVLDTREIKFSINKNNEIKCEKIFIQVFDTAL